MSADLEGDQEQSGAAPRPRMRKIASDAEFQSCVAVANLAVELCALKKAELQKQWDAEDKSYHQSVNVALTDADKERLSKERENYISRRMKTLEPKGFLSEAWRLIEAAREHVSPPVGMSQAQAELWLNEKLLVPFKKLCDPKRKKGDSETICGEHWKVYRSSEKKGKQAQRAAERAFDNLFWAYWHEIGEKWRDPIQAEEQGKLRFDGNSVQMFSNEERKLLGKRARDKRAWKELGKKKLASWKRDGLPLADFLAIARFRRERDKRAENLPKKH